MIEKRVIRNILRRKRILIGMETANWKNKIRFEYIVFIVVFVLFLLSLSRFCMHGEPKTVLSDDTAETYIGLYDGIEIRQPVTITEEMDWRAGSYALKIAYVSAKSDGKVVWKIEQDSYVEEKTVAMQDIAVQMEEDGFYSIPLDFTQLSEGTAMLSLTTTDVAEGEIELVFGTDYYGFGEAVINGSGSGMTLYQKYAYHITGYEYWIRLGCYGVVIFCMVLLCFLLFGKEESRKRCYVVFAVLTGMFLAVFYIYDSSVIMQPTYAEAVTNFMKYAREESLVENLMITDAGYLPLLPRLITLFFIKVLRFPAADALYFMQAAACLGCSMIWAFFVLYPFHEYLSLPMRVVFCMLVMAVCFEQETLFFTNFPYWGILFMLLFMLSDMKAWSRIGFGFLTLTCALFCLSKGAYVIMLPFMLLYLVFFRTELNARQKCYGWSLAGAALLQLLYSFAGNGDGTSWIDAGNMGQIHYWLKMLCKVCVDMGNYLFIWLGKWSVKLIPLLLAATVITIILMVTGFVKKVLLPGLRKEKIADQWIAVYSMLLFLAISAAFYRITVKSVPDAWPEVFAVSYEQMGGKYEIFCDVAVLLLFMLFISMLAEKLEHKKEVYRNKVHSIGILSLFLLFCTASPRLQLCGLGQMDISDKRVYEGNLNTDWQQVKTLINSDAFFLPVRGDFWSYSRNVTVYQVGEENYFEESVGRNLGEMDAGYHSFYTIEEGMEAENIIEIWVHRPNRITGAPYRSLLLDEQGNILEEAEQFGNAGSSKTGFVFEKPVNGVKTIAFIDCNGNEVYIDDYICWVSAW